MTDESKDQLESIANQSDLIIKKLDAITRNVLINGGDERALLAALSIHLGKTLAIIMTASESDDERIMTTKLLISNTIEASYQDSLEAAQKAKAETDAEWGKKND